MSNPFQPTSVEYLAAALPPDGANPIGAAARGILVNRTKGATPGHWSQLFGTGPAFRDVFFPGLVADPRGAEIQRLTGLDDEYFRNLAVVTLCQQMGLTTSRLRPQVLMGPIGQDLAAWNGRLRSVAWAWYAYCLGAVDGDTRTALAAFPDADSRARARGQYLQGLTGDAWINDKLVQLASGSWSNPAWELFHHWSKLVALGTAIEEIDGAITTIRGKGLPIPDPVGPGSWRSWTGWLGGDIGGRDLPDAVKPILDTKCEVYPGASWPSCMDEAASFEFTANSQPGNRYRQAPSGSCFTAGSLVVLADGGLRPIEQVVPGEVVATPSGPRAVVLVANPLRAGRAVFGFAGQGFGFMASHPFLVHDPAPGAPGSYAAVDPEALARAVPTLTQFGVQALRDGAPMLSAWRAEGGPVPFAPPQVVPREPGPDEAVYDLILEPTADGRSEYFVGDERVQVLVSSEIPRYLAAPETAAVVVSVLQACAEPILRELASVPDAGFADLLSIGLDAAARTMMPRVGPALAPDGLPRAEAQLLDSRPRGVLAGVSGLTASLGDGGGYDRRAATLIEQFLPRFAPQIQAAIGLGWRSFALATQGGATVLAVSVYSFDLFEPASPLDAGDAEIVLTLSTDGAEWTRALAVRPTAVTNHWYFSTDEVGYFDQWRPTLAGEAPAVGGNWRLRIGLRGRSTGQTVPGSASLLLPSSVGHGFQARSLPVLDDAGSVVGQVAFDVRALGPDGLRQDVEGRAAWTPADEAVVATRLAAAVSEVLPDAVASGVLVFRSAAATPEGHRAGALLASGHDR